MGNGQGKKKYGEKHIISLLIIVPILQENWTIKVGGQGHCNLNVFLQII